MANGLVVVTGGGSGIGRAVALRQAAQGDEVVVVGRRREALEATAAAAPADRIRPVAADLMTTDGAEVLAQAVRDRSVTGVVCAAGGQGGFFDPGPTLPGTAQAYRDALELNLITAVHTVEALVPRLLDGRGRVVLISSTAALDGAGGPYATAKAALDGYGRELAARLGPRGVTANSVAPGYVADTEFFDNGFLGDDLDTDATARAAAAGTRVGRVGRPDDIAAAVEWLLSPEGGFTTGQVVSPNGGTVLVR